MTDTIVVTGVSRGLGRHFAEGLHEEGYRVVGLARKPDQAAAFETISCDVSDADAVTKAFRPFRRDKSVFALINAAGIASMNLLVSTPLDTIRRIVETNLLGTIYCCHEFMPALIRRGAGRIINFSTIAVSIGLKGESAYVASKAGVEGFSRVLAREMADYGVTVNTIAPGPIDTDLIAKVPDVKIESIVRQQVIARKCTPSDVLDIVRLLLDGKSATITGQVLHVGGA